MSKRLAKRASRRAVVAGLAGSALLALDVLCGGASAAPAEVAVTTQAQADNGAFLAYAPAPAQPAGLCLVDTGVDLNPDTQDRVVYRTAIDGGSGDDTSPEEHGTLMAMMAAAPANGWGMVGTAPRAIRIVSVRILEPGQTTFPFADYTDAITVCLQLQSEYNIKVINLSLGTAQTPSSEDYAAISNALAQANQYGVDVVAAAGNDTGGPLDYPAALPSVLSVAATDAKTGAFCGFSNRGSGLRLLAPGCDLDAADPVGGTMEENYWQGTSEASVTAAAALTALRAYQPTLTTQQAENDLTSTESGTLNIAAAFQAAGLANVVAAGTAAEPPAPTDPTAQPPDSPAPASTAITPSAASGTGQAGTPLPPLATPKVKISRHGKRIEARFANRPPDTTIELRLLGYVPHSHRLALLRSRETNARSVVLTPGAAVELQARYRDTYDTGRTSHWTTTLILHETSHPVRAGTRA